MPIDFQLSWLSTMWRLFDDDGFERLAAELRLLDDAPLGFNRYLLNQSA